MLKNFKIGTQIGLGFFLVLVVSALMVAFAIRGLQSSGASFRAYRELARASLLSGRVQANMLSALSGSLWQRQNRTVDPGEAQGRPILKTKSAFFLVVWVIRVCGQVVIQGHSLGRVPLQSG